MSYASTIPILSRQIMMCELCGGEHNMGECLNDDMGSKSSMEHVDLVGYGRQQQSFQPQGAYNPNTPRNHPGFSWSNPMGAANPQNFGNRGPPPGFQGQQNFRGGEQQQSRPNQGFQAPTTQPRQSSENSPPPNWEAMMEMMFKSQMKSDERLRQLTEKLDQLGAHNKMLERQIANQASTSSTQVTGKLPAYPENPREHVNAIITRSGKELEEPSLQIHKPMPKERSNGEIEEVEKEEATPPTYIPNQQVHNKDDGVKPERKYPKSPFVEKCYRVDVVGNKRLEKGEEFDALDERYFDEHKRFKKNLHEEVGDVAILEKESKMEAKFYKISTPSPPCPLFRDGEGRPAVRAAASSVSGDGQQSSAVATAAGSALAVVSSDLQQRHCGRTPAVELCGAAAVEQLING
nr:uncharacterized protein LOC109152581 [Ipomoea batatas]